MNSMELRSLWWLVIFVLVLSHVNRCYCCWEQERIALLQLKASINYPSGTSLPSWEDSVGNESNCCVWERVECDLTSGHVTKLALNSTSLRVWFFEASLFLPFKELRNLDLSDNKLSGWLTNEGFERLTRLEKLEVLRLDFNYFDSSILPSLGVLSSLKRLYLKQNRLTGTIQIQDLNAMSNLVELDLSLNTINGLTIKRGTKSLQNLQVLGLQGFTLRDGRLLQSMATFKSLKKLTLSVEGLITEKDLQGLTNLHELNLDLSYISGNFIEIVGMMTSLRVLSLHGSGLSGRLPSQGWCDLKKLEVLDLSANDFVGLLPSCLGNLTSLRILDLSFNHLSGNIALSPIPSIMLLEYLSFAHNHFIIPFSFAPFFNHSRLEVILSDNSILNLDNEIHSWIPKFQLKAFSLSNCSVETLPNFLYYQNDLIVVDLSYNKLVGKFPSWLLGNNTRLEELSIRSNLFTGPFQFPSHPNYPQIIALDLSDNHIDSQIPTNLNLLFPKLETLNMSNNMLGGDIPPSLGEIGSSLKILDLSNNNLSGSIPENLAVSCSSLIILKLSNNSLQGQLLPKVLNLSKLVLLYLDTNHFSGRIPYSLSNTTSLLTMEISNNHLSGTLPEWLGNMSTLIHINMAKNQLEGPFPIELCKLSKLVFLDLSENNLSGSIPSCFNSSSSIKHVHLNRNGISGPLTRVFCSSLSLVTLDLSYNKLSGTVPDWIGSLLALRIILLKGNNFEGEIPTQLCQLNKISLIDLSHNYLSGSIPRCMINITFEATDKKSLVDGLFLATSTTKCSILSIMRVTNMGMEEPINIIDFSIYDYSWYSVNEEVEFTTKNMPYSYRGNILNFMSGVDFSCNRLTGEIPMEIGNLTQIRALNMSHNNLSGPIPTTLSNLRHIESLDLSYNNLNGSIPSQLTNLSFLAVFSVAHNNLSGRMPDMNAQFATFEESSYEGNPYLCGPPLQNNCTSTASISPKQHASDDEEEDDHFIDMNIFYASFSVSYVTVLLGIAAVLCINPCWRRIWFDLIEVCINSCWYFILDSFRKVSNFGDMYISM